MDGWTTTTTTFFSLSFLKSLCVGRPFLSLSLSLSLSSFVSLFFSLSLSLCVSFLTPTSRSKALSFGTTQNTKHTQQHTPLVVKRATLFICLCGIIMVSNDRNNQLCASFSVFRSLSLSLSLCRTSFTTPRRGVVPLWSKPFVFGLDCLVHSSRNDADG